MLRTFKIQAPLIVGIYLLAYLLSVSVAGGANKLKEGVWLGDSVEYIAGQILVKFTDSADSAAKQRVLDALDGTILDTCGCTDFILVEIDTSKDVPQECEDILDSQQVEKSEPSFPVYVASEYNDPLYDSQWSINNTGQQNIWGDMSPDDTIDAVVGADIHFIEAMGIAESAASIKIGWVDAGIVLDSNGNIESDDFDTSRIILGPAPVSEPSHHTHGTPTLSVAGQHERHYYRKGDKTR